MDVLGLILGTKTVALVALMLAAGSVLVSGIALLGVLGILLTRD